MMWTEHKCNHYLYRRNPTTPLLNFFAKYLKLKNQDRAVLVCPCSWTDTNNLDFSVKSCFIFLHSNPSQAVVVRFYLLFEVSLASYRKIIVNMRIRRVTVWKHERFTIIPRKRWFWIICWWENKKEKRELNLILINHAYNIQNILHTEAVVVIWILIWNHLELTTESIPVSYSDHDKFDLNPF